MKTQRIPVTISKYYRVTKRSRFQRKGSLTYSASSSREYGGPAGSVVVKKIAAPMKIDAILRLAARLLHVSAKPGNVTFRIDSMAGGSARLTAWPTSLRKRRQGSLAAVTIEGLIPPVPAWKDDDGIWTRLTDGIDGTYGFQPLLDVLRNQDARLVDGDWRWLEPTRDVRYRAVLLSTKLALRLMKAVNRRRGALKLADVQRIERFAVNVIARRKGAAA